MSEEIPLAGVVGYPIGHSRSPAMHAHWLARYGIEGHYVPLAITLQHLESAIRDLPKLGFKGINVTQPYKETMLSMADQISDRAALIGAVNTISFREGGGISADNTDGYGFLENLESSARWWQAKAGSALVLGAGGAARAVVVALLQAGVPELWLANRTKGRAETLAEQFGAKVQVIDWNRAEDAMAGAVTIVNTTSLGMEGGPEMKLGFRAASPGALATDIVYTPLDTPFLLEARAAGLRTVDGLGMLLHQGVPGFRQWFGVRPDVDDALRHAVLSA